MNTRAVHNPFRAVQEGPVREALSAALRQRTATNVADDAGWDDCFGGFEEDEGYEDDDEDEQIGVAGGPAELTPGWLGGAALGEDWRWGRLKALCVSPPTL